MALIAQHDNVAAIRGMVTGWRAAGRTTALVPTMGNLHQGHLRLVEQAGRDCDHVVVSIFVNPTQFGPQEDFAAYPRTLAADMATLSASGAADILFTPQVSEIYPRGLEDIVQLNMPRLSTELCGAVRPGHFDGVAGVVLRLLNTVQPDCLYLGEKDLQQLILMRQMAEELLLPVEIRSVPTEREADGLAMSSRNRYLSEAERRAAPGLQRTLLALAERIREGERDFAALTHSGAAALGAAGFRVDYVAIRAASDLGEVSGDSDQPLVILAAAWLGKARLIDNLRV